MSSNRKNRRECAFLRPFTEDILQRAIIIENPSVAKYYKQDPGLRSITELLNSYIQELNLRVDRNIPYMSLTASTECQRISRIYLRDSTQSEGDDLDEDENVFLEIGEQDFLEITHLIDLFVLDGDSAIDEPINSNFNVELIFNHMFTRMMIIDIFLDVSFFNSYSFLRNATYEEKRRFSSRKFEFFKSKRLTSCFWEVNENLDYYSFAFSCHKNVENGTIKSGNYSDFSIEFDLDLDLKKYIEIWDEFIQTYYPDKTHHEKTIQQQIEMHVDNKQMPDLFFQEFDQLPSGIYYILRLNRIIPYYRNQLASIFLGSTLSIGLLKIVELKEINNYFDLFNDKIISGFKIVKQ